MSHISGLPAMGSAKGSTHPTDFRQLRGFSARHYLFDNSSCDEPYRLLATFERGRLIRRADVLPNWTNGVPGLE